MNKNFQNDLKTALSESLRSQQGALPEDIQEQVSQILKDVDQEMCSKRKEKLDGQIIKMEIQDILEKGIEIDYNDQKKYFSINLQDHEFDDRQEELFQSVVLSTTFPDIVEDKEVFGFYDFSKGVPQKILNLYWVNMVGDGDSPYNTPFFDRKWCYTEKNIIKDERIIEYIKRRTK